MSLTVSTRTQGDVTILVLQGRVTLGPDNVTLSNALQDAVAKNVRKLLLNMAGVTHMDTSGISSLVRGFVGLQRSGGRLALVAMPERIRMVLDMTRLLNVIPVFSDEAAALAGLK